MEVKGCRARFYRGSWHAVISWEDGHGRHERHIGLGCASEEDARIAALELFYKARLGEIDLRPSGDRSGLFPYAYSYFKGRMDRREYERSTFSTNMKHMRAWERVLGQRPIGSVTESDVRDAISGWFADGRDATTVDKRITALNEVYKSAVRENLCRRNPLDRVKRPKKGWKEPNGVNDAAMLSKTASAIAAMPLDAFKVAFSLALYTGMRRGEICALRWCDVDLRSGTIWIRAAIGSDDGGKYAKAPKSGRHRDVAVPRALSEVLADWSAACKTSSAGRVGPRWHVVCDGDGGFVNPDYLTHAFTDFARFNGLEGAAGRRLTLHDLRHTAATVLISNGADVKTVQSVLGHSSAAITLDMYASADADAKRSAARILDLAI